ncbi:MAG: hypothetical protein BAA01_05505 [Bacillus thermozeamaize]|uniref:DUF2269 domain-containing protein n=1 Tax=Bacillus thermozeamaize TaxID=230954 RepID=A0A1Y3PMI1_9BACI|nr:MAG: hypothetical protein BAA01_05505 [Bacillus thermozeamaize]
MPVHGIHSFSAVVFAILILLPIQAMRLRRMTPGKITVALKPWRIFLQVAHLFLVIALVTGLLLRPDFSSVWFWVVLLVFIVLGALLGITAKSLREVADTAKSRQPHSRQLQKLSRFSILLALSVIVMILLMVLH